MGVKIRERALASGEVAFYIDTYHRDYGRFSQKTGLQANPKDRKAYKAAQAAALDKVRQIEKDLARDAAGVFGRKERSTDDFIQYYANYANRKGQPPYLNTLKHLVRCFGGVAPFESLNTAWLERFRGYILSQDTISQNTAGVYLSTVKAVIRRAFREGYVDVDFTPRIQNIKKDEIVRRFLSLEEIGRLSMAVAPNSMVKQAFLFGCFTGMRLSDIEALQWAQISLVNGAPFIEFRQQKTGGVERLPLSEQAVRTLQAVKDLHVEYAPSGSEHVFILPTRPVISKHLHKWGDNAGLNWPLHFHSSRHTFATLALTQGNDLFTVSKLLGHREIGTTQVYSHIIDAKKVDAVNQLPVLPDRIEANHLPGGAEKDLFSGVTKSLCHSSGSDRIEAQASPAAKGSIQRALEAEGEKIAKALRLPQDGQGRYLFEGKAFTAAELALEASQGEQ